MPKKCKKCGADSTVQSTFCGDCGGRAFYAPRTEEAQAPGVAEGEAATCSTCGVPVASEVALARHKQTEHPYSKAPAAAKAPRWAAILSVAAVVGLVAILATQGGSSDGGSDDGTGSTEAEVTTTTGRGPAENLAIVVHGRGYTTADVADASKFIGRQLARCPDMADAEAVADLTAGVGEYVRGKVGDDRYPYPEIVDGLDTAFEAVPLTPGLKCKDVAAGYTALLVAGD
jgi:hypothetical protein